jgi:hypothetical protein
MPNWKKVILSGSNAHINNLTASGHVSALDNSFTVNNHTSTELFVDGNITSSNLLILNTASITYFETTYQSSSIIFSSGSTKFGDTMDDTHTFTGSLFITGITYDSTPQPAAAVLTIDTASGRLYYTGSYGGSGGSGTGFPYAGSDDFTSDPPIAVITGSLTLSGSGHITASGNVNVSGDVTTTNINLSDLIYHNNNTTTRFGFTNNHEIQFLSNAHQVLLLDKANGSRLGINSSPLEVTGTEILLSGEVTASNNISASGDVLASNFTTPKGGQLNVNTGQIRSINSSNVLFIDGTDASSIDFNDGESDVDVRIRGVNGNYYFKTDAGAEKVGIGGNFNTTVPGEELTVHGNISASGALFASLSLDNSNLNTVMYNTSTGKFFHTGSYGGGGGGGGTPAGVNKSIQFNDSGVFGGNNLFNYDSTFNSVSVTTSQAGTIGLASPNNGSSLFINTNRDLFLAERATPDTIFGVFDRLNRYLCLQPHTVNGSANTISTTHQPSARLHILDKPQNPSGVLIKSINQDTGGRFNLLLGTAMPLNSTGTHRFISFHHTSGNDGGTALNGGIFFDPNNNIQGGLQGGISSVVFQGVFVQSSDKKLKKHITFTKKGVDDIMSIKVKDFRWKEQLKDTPKNTGFIAQDLLETHPEIIRNIDGTLNVEYDKMIPLLVKAIQDQQHQIDDLKEQLKNKQL